MKTLQKKFLSFSTVVFCFAMGNPISSFAATVTAESSITDTSATSPSFLSKVSGLLTEPLGWIKWLAILGGVLLIAVNGLKYKAANGDPQKIEKAMSGLKSVIIGAVIIFCAAGFGQWFFGKLE